MAATPNASQRTFIRLLEAAIGGVTLAPLTGCGGDNDSSVGRENVSASRR